MLFNSPEFLLVFLPISLLLFWLAAKTSGGRAAQLTLIGSSMVFYAWWKWEYLALILCGTVANYLLGGWLLKRQSRLLLTIGISLNVGLLGYFKYTNFAIENLSLLFGADISSLNIILPLGISFFTFQKIGYLVDCYKGLVHERDPLRFGLFVLFFPQLIAGPIVHHGQIIPQLKQHEANPLPSQIMVAQGLFYLIVGLFKKVIIADNIANIIVPGFANVHALQFVEAWTVAIGYSLQIYFDFSAYSEMAIGLGLLFGVMLPINFNSPYKATSISDFWRRWHMTLGAFMRSYLYVPMGGNRKGVSVMVFASLATMLIGGLWHGAAWTFVLWGAMHGTMLVIHKVWRSSGAAMGARAAHALTLLGVVFAWVPFRASSISDTLAIWSKMVGAGGISLPMGYQALPGMKEFVSTYHLSNIFNGFEWIGLVVLFYFAVTARNTHERWDQFQPSIRSVVLLTGMSLAGLFSLSQPSTFLYFNF